MTFVGETLDFYGDDVIEVAASQPEDDVVRIDIGLNTLHAGEGDNLVFRHGAWVIEAGDRDTNDRMFAFMVGN